MIRVQVPLPERAYDVVVGAGAAERAGRRRCPSGARRVAVVTQAGVPDLDDPGPSRRALRRSATASEHKTLATVEELCRGFARVRAHPGRRRGRASAAAWSPTSAGFAAASYHRGVAGRARRRPRCSAWSTPRSAARPASTCRRARTWSARSGSRPAVLCDLDAAGHAARRGSALRARRDGQVPLPHRRRPARPAARRAHRPLRRDQGRRSWPATSARRGAAGRCSTTATRSAHALEIAGDHDLRHGEAVAIGLVYAAELARGARPHRRGPGRRAPRASSARYDLDAGAARRPRPRRAAWR